LQFSGAQKVVQLRQLGLQKRYIIEATVDNGISLQKREQLTNEFRRRNDLDE